MFFLSSLIACSFLVPASACLCLLIIVLLALQIVLLLLFFLGQAPIDALLAFPAGAPAAEGGAVSVSASVAHHAFACARNFVSGVLQAPSQQDSVLTCCSKQSQHKSHIT
jgi:hypothetical protein